MEKLRLDKYLSSAQCGMSRKEARTAIRRGRVTAGGEVIRDPSFLLDGGSRVTLDGQAVEYKKYIYILMNKPAGVLSAASDASRKTVIDLIPPQLKRSQLAPVGRLDKDTTGLLLITDDGDFAHRCISPKHKLTKTYLAELDGEVDEAMIRCFSQGIVLADGTACRPALLEKVGECAARITVTEGKYHQIKRMLGVVGLGVNKLHREAIGGLRLPQDLKAGECRELSAEELSAVMQTP